MSPGENRRCLVKNIPSLRVGGISKGMKPRKKFIRRTLHQKIPMDRQLRLIVQKNDDDEIGCSPQKMSGITWFCANEKYGCIILESMFCCFHRLKMWAELGCPGRLFSSAGLTSYTANIPQENICFIWSKSRWSVDATKFVLLFIGHGGRLNISWSSPIQMQLHFNQSIIAFF